MFVVVLEASHSPSIIDGLFGIVGHAVKTLCYHRCAVRGVPFNLNHVSEVV